jgi:hypothetical protein
MGSAVNTRIDISTRICARRIRRTGRQNRTSRIHRKSRLEEPEDKADVQTTTIPNHVSITRYLILNVKVRRDEKGSKRGRRDSMINHVLLSRYVYMRIANPARIACNLQTVLGIWGSWTPRSVCRLAGMIRVREFWLMVKGTCRVRVLAL